MADVHLYFGIENLALTDPQKQTLVDTLKMLGQRNGGLPHERNHWRVRPDDNAVIFEAIFDSNNLTALQMRTYLASIFGVNVSLITSSLATPNFSGSRQSQVLTFTYNSIQRLRSVAFGSVSIGGIDTTWEQSRIEADSYLIANAGVWG